MRSILQENKKRILSLLMSITMVCSAFTNIGGLTAQAAGTDQTGKNLVCGKEEHSHAAECYEQGDLTCTQAESEGHTHDDSCYKKTLICDNTEEGHEHTADCYAKTLTCDKEETAGHFQ